MFRRIARRTALLKAINLHNSYRVKNALHLFNRGVITPAGKVRYFSLRRPLFAEIEEKKPDEDIVIEEDEAVNAEKLRTEELIKETEQIRKDTVETRTFQTETKQLLNIVATALYTDKEVFIRELISNASDALEKVRQRSLSQDAASLIEDPNIPLEVNISVDEKLKTFTIQDSGIGMTKEELIKNIGTIAHSGSKAFVQALQQEGKDAAAHIIGQFGVGFYSVFMVADSVRVYTRSAKPGSKGYCWESVGEGEFSISEAEGVARGTKIVLQLKESEKEYSMRETVERIIKKYSNFVAYPIKLNGSKVDTLQAIWLKKDITPEEHKEFYKYLSHSMGDPMYTIQFHVDIPLSVHALFYVPDSHMERMGMGKMDPGVNVYCKKVLIQAKHRDILPDWLRFIKGAVDSEDLPLHISREHLQNSPLIRRINGILTRKILRFFVDMQKMDMKKYTKFYNEFGKFLKEGIASDLMYKEELAKCLIFESSKTSGDERITLDDYVERMQPDQNEIYYIIAANREYADNSPYMEVFKKKNIEVLYLFSPVDEFVMGAIQRHKNKEIKSVENAEIKDEEAMQKEGLTEDQVKELGRWWTESLAGKLETVEASSRLHGTPAIIKNPENAAMRLMRNIQAGQVSDLGPQKLEINASHPIIMKLYQIMHDDVDTAKVVATQIFNNALTNAGLIDDPRSIVGNINQLLEVALKDVKIPEIVKEATQE